MPELLVTAATLQPISLDEAKLFLRVTHNKEDSEIQSAIEDATRFLEDRIGQQFITATWKAILPCFPDEPFRLPRPPLQAIGSITYIDINGAGQTLAASQYQVDILRRPGRLMLAYGVSSWPDIRPDTFNPVVIQYTAGYGDTAASVPPAIKRAIKFLVNWWYQQREPIVIGSITQDVDLTLDSLLASVWHGEYAGLVT